MNLEHPPNAQDGLYMALALAEAAKGLGRTSPNPPVGCLIVRDGQLVGRGFHPRAGEPHAEIFALREAGERARGATAYVTLEPCSHSGRTPPCADALLEAGLARVVVAALDPNPRVNGQGIQKLRDAGIEVLTGLLEAEALAQQAGFRSVILRNRPHVIYKYAMTLDGKVAAPGESNGAVTGPQARALVMQWRDQSDAIAIGSGTLLADDPALTTRGIEGGQHPRPVIFDRRGRTPVTARALRPDSLLVCSPQANTEHLAATGATILRTESLTEALKQLAQHQISTLLLEGGPALASAFLEAGLIDEIRAFIAPKLLGAGLTPLQAPHRRMAEALHLRELRLEQVGEEVLMRGMVKGCEP